MALRRVGVLAAALAAACTSSKPKAPAHHGLGKLVSPGLARNLVASPDGRWLAWLDGCEKPKGKGMPDDAFLCDLELSPVPGREPDGSAGRRAEGEGGGMPTAPRRVARGVTNLGAGFAWAADGKALAALDSYDFAKDAGALVLAPVTDRAPEKLGDGVSFYAFARGAPALGYVAGGQLYLAPESGGPAKPLAGADRIATFEFAAGGDKLVARRRGDAGGALLFAQVEKGEWRLRPAPLAEHVADYGFSRPGNSLAWTTFGKEGNTLFTWWRAGAEEAPPELGRAVGTFAFDETGDAIAFTADVSRDNTTGTLYVATRTEPPAKLAAKVGELHWAEKATRLAWLQEYNRDTRSGTLAAGGPGLKKPVVLAKNVPSFSLSPDGTLLAYLERITAGTFSVDLFLAKVERGAKPTPVARGVFGFDFSPDGKALLYRTACVRNAESCDLYSVPAAGGEPKKLAEGVKSFDFSQGRGDRLLVTWMRKDLVALDLALFEGGKLTAIDNAALPGSAAFLAPDDKRVAYVDLMRRREGVYVAPLP